MANKHMDTCLQKAGADEPIFVLRAQDNTASNVVRFWAAAARRAGCSDEKVNGAYEIADEMDAWAKANGAKVPD